MTAYRFVTLTCDTCYEVFDDGRSTKIREARAAARIEGWRSKDGEDSCPVHNGYRRSSLGGYEKDADPPNAG